MIEAGRDVLDDAGRVRIIVGVLIAMLLAALDQTIVTPAVATMGKRLGGETYLFWIVSAYFLTATASTPLYGKLADIYGRRPVLLAGIGIFVLGSIAAALAPSMLWLILARALQGLGGGGLIALAQTVIGDLVPAKERGRFAVYISGTWAIASIAGPILGGVIAEHLHWSVIF
jgi:MFS family permease